MPGMFRNCPYPGCVGACQEMGELERPLCETGVETNAGAGPDLVNEPPHYRVGGLECIDVIEALRLGYHLGNALKYLWRAGRKGDIAEDLRKAVWFIKRKIELIEADEDMEALKRPAFSGSVDELARHLEKNERSGRG